MNRRFFVTGFVVLAIGYVFAISHSQTDTHANVSELVKSAVVADTANNTEPAESDNRPADVAASNLTEIEQTRALVHVQRPQWRQNESLVQLFEELKAQASDGNTAPAYVLGMNLRHCYYVPVDDVGLAEKLLQASEFKDNGQALADIQRGYDYCEGISRAERDGFYRYLELAAVQGNVPAQEAIADLTPELYMAANNFAELGRDEYVEKRQSFVRQQLDFLASAAQRGSLKALVKLSQLHYAQTAGEDGRLQAYAFNEMILALSDDSELQNRYHWFQQRALNEFTAEELERAVAMAEQWLAKINANGSLYSHNN